MIGIAPVSNKFFSLIFSHLRKNFQKNLVDVFPCCIIASSNNNKNTKTMESLKQRLWDERGYDYKYLNTLTNVELITLYDSEFSSDKDKYYWFN